MVRYSGGMFILINNTDETKYIPWKKIIFVRPSRCNYWWLFCFDASYHNLGKDEHYDIWWFAAGYGIKKLQVKRQMLELEENEENRESSWLWLLTFVNVNRSPRIDVTTIHPTRKNDMCWDQKPTSMLIPIQWTAISIPRVTGSFLPTRSKTMFMVDWKQRWPSY